MNWKHLFTNEILDRGFDYYNRKFVEHLDVNEEAIAGIVLGSEDYEVCIDLENGEIVSMFCDCPYAIDGRNCKHMAAVLFATGDESTYSLKNEDDVAKLVREGDPSIVQDFLIQILENDEKLLNRFKNLLGCEISSMDMERYKRQIDEILGQYVDRDEFTNYNYTSYYDSEHEFEEFVSELEDFLQHNINDMVINKQYQEAFELINYLLLELGNEDLEELEGMLDTLGEICLEIWQDILNFCGIQLKRTFFKCYLNHLENPNLDFISNYIEEAVFTGFMEAEFTSDKFKVVEEKILSSKQLESSWSRKYTVGKWVLKYIDMLEEQQTDQKLIDEYYQKHLEYSGVRNDYVESLIKKQEYQLAINVLKEGKEVEQDSRGLVTEFSLQLKELYRKIGANQAYENELWDLILDFKAGNLDIFKELKLFYSEEEWKEKREIIFEKLPSNCPLDRLYKEEQLYDRLLGIVLGVTPTTLYKLKEYENDLIEIYPTELLNKYQEIVEDMASSVSNRQRYQEIVSILRRMEEYPEGIAIVNELVRQWQVLYKNRRAMMDELRKL